MADYFLIEFRVEGDPVVISKIVGIGGVAGEIGRTGNKILVWRLKSISPENSSESWISLDDGILEILKILLPIKSKLDCGLVGLRSYWWCGFFSSGFGGSINLSADIMRKMGSLGYPFYLDSYTSDVN